VSVNTTDFWGFVDVARADVAQSTTGHPGEAFADRPATTSKQTILEYKELFEGFQEALCRWDLWAAAYLIGGGCSDDSFMDFRAGLIAQGRDWYERAAASPDALADHPHGLDDPLP
jgi:hypothetical protein